LTNLDHFSRAVRGRSRAVTRPIMLGGAAVLALASLGTATAASAASAVVPARAPAISLTSAAAKFTVGGHTWFLTVGDLNPSVNITISTAHEFDAWIFSSASAATLKVNKKTGNATFNAHNSLAPIAFFNLTFTATSRSKVPCRSGSETDFTGRLAGSVTLVANHKGLKFKSAHARFSLSLLSIDNGCVLRPRTGPTPCFAGFWDAGTTVGASGSAPGLPARRTFSVGITKIVELTSPANTLLDMEVFGTAKKPVFDSKKKKLRVSASGSGGITGSAILTATQRPTSTSSRCAMNGKPYKAHDVNYLGSYISPKGGQFQARSILAGQLKVARTGFATFHIVTLKPA
jgi:hypothetical protein